MSTEQVVTYRKPAFIEKAQADLIKAIEDFIAKDAAKGLPERFLISSFTLPEPKHDMYSAQPFTNPNTGETT